MSYTAFPKYLSPHFVRDEGRRLDGAFCYDKLIAQLDSNELPYGVFNTGVYWIAALMTDVNIFVDMDTNALQSEFYAVNKNKAKAEMTNKPVK